MGRVVSWVVAGLVGCTQPPSSEPDAGTHDGGATDAGSPTTDGGVDAGRAESCERIVEIDLSPTRHAQLAIWIEEVEPWLDGKPLSATIRLTEAVARRGIGNRPGASQMNSGFRWPVGRRLNALPRWAYRRLELGGRPFPTVVFQRRPEGYRSAVARTASHDSYFCQFFGSWPQAREAVTCKDIVATDKGRFITSADVAAGLAEPFQHADGSGSRRRLRPTSPYPPRRDVLGDGENDHPDAARFAEVALAAMPELDAVTMASLGESRMTVVHVISEDWPDGDYLVTLEIHTEHDYNDAYNPTTYPTPTEPRGAWDYWAEFFGHPYRGQPSVVFQTRVHVSRTRDSEDTTRRPIGRTGVDGLGGALFPPTDITDDPEGAPGSGADRLRMLPGGWRLRTRAKCVATR